MRSKGTLNNIQKLKTEVMPLNNTRLFDKEMTQLRAASLDT